MGTPHPIRGILFDSGDTLVRPAGANWWPGHRFYEVVASGGVERVKWSRLDDALAEGMRYLETNHLVPTEEEERDQFREFYTMVLRSLDVDDPNGAMADELGYDAVDRIGMEPFDDTHRVVAKLFGRGLKLGIVSDTWPSLDRKYRSLGLREFFDPFVMSSMIGFTKPDERLFRLGIEGLGLPPQDILFVDNEPRYVEAAIALGLKGVVITRGGGPVGGGLPGRRVEAARGGRAAGGGLDWVRNLDELEALLA